MERWEIEQLRRSVAMLAPGHSAGALTKDHAVQLFREIERITEENDRYREAVAELRRILAVLDRGSES